MPQDKKDVTIVKYLWILMELHALAVIDNLDVYQGVEREKKSISSK